MICQEDREIERRVIAILKVLNDSHEPIGGRTIARRLGDFGIELGERAVRYHLRLMDERGLTSSVGERDGRLITLTGMEEVENALVYDRVGLISTKIKLLAYLTSFDPDRCTGEVPINISLFSEGAFNHAREVMKNAFESEFCLSNLVAVVRDGERLGDVSVPEGKVGVATVSNIMVIGTLLKSGIPLDPRFAGILQIRNHTPLRFVELIEHTGCSLSPMEIFIASNMTTVSEVENSGDGRILAHFYELPAVCKSAAETIINKLKIAGVGGVITIGEMNQPVCEVSVGRKQAGLILLSGLNPVAAAKEKGIMSVNHAMSGMVDYEELIGFQDLVE